MSSALLNAQNLSALLKQKYIMKKEENLEILIKEIILNQIIKNYNSSFTFQTKKCLKSPLFDFYNSLLYN